jgi:hypothetical protein
MSSFIKHSFRTLSSRTGPVNVGAWFGHLEAPSREKSAKDLMSIARETGMLAVSHTHITPQLATDVMEASTHTHTHTQIHCDHELR